MISHFFTVPCAGFRFLSKTCYYAAQSAANPSSTFLSEWIENPLPSSQLIQLFLYR